MKIARKQKAVKRVFLEIFGHATKLKRTLSMTVIVQTSQAQQCSPALGTKAPERAREHCCALSSSKGTRSVML